MENKAAVQGATWQGDVKTAATAGEKGLLGLLLRPPTPLTTTAFAASVLEWIKTARHPRFNRPYTELVYQPMLELMAYLRANGFKTFIMSGRRHHFHRGRGPRGSMASAEQVAGSPAWDEV